MKDELLELSGEGIPTLLKEIPNAPQKIYVRGALPDTKDTKWLTVVGTRAYTPYGKDVVNYLISGLSGYPIVIVSGLALGIDSIAHRAALDANLPTVAIPGSGLRWDVMYPRTNVPLAKNIIEAGGAHLSEFEPDFRAEKWSFLKRNRIMAGISHATLIIEATEKSGTMVTARLATDYNRDVLIVPGSIFNETSKGNHLYLRHGATLVSCANEILDVLGIKEKPSSLISQNENLSENERKILELLSSPITRDELIRKSGLSPLEINTLLSSMEIAGLIEENMGFIRKS